MSQIVTLQGVGRPAGSLTGASSPGPNPANDPTLWDPIVVEVTQLDGDPAVVTWLGPAGEVDRPINDLPTASLPVVLSDGYLVNVGTEDLPDLRPLEEVLPNDATVTIRTARPEIEQDVTLFRGYVSLNRRTAKVGKECAVELVHVADDLGRDPERAIHGQLWLTRADEADYAQAAEPAVVPKVDTGWPAVFNPDGAKNCRKKLTWLSDAAEEQIAVPLWAHRFYEDRQAWTWARVFMFLLYWARRNADGTLGSMPHGLQDANLWALIEERGYHLEDPDNLSDGGDLDDPWARVLLGRPVSLALEGMDWMQALKWTCARSGVGFTIDAWHDQSDGTLHEEFRFFVPGGSRQVELGMPSKHFDTHDKTWVEVRAKADVSNLALAKSYAGCTNAAIGAGAAKRYEVTVELVPGWDYDEDRDPQVDVDPDDSDAIDEAVAAIEGDAWTNQYCTNGQDFFDHDYWAVLRHWIAPDFADLSASAKVRPFGYFVASKYEALDLADLEVGEVWDGSGFRWYRSSVRPRPLKRCLTGIRPGQTFPPIVQVSCRSGVDGSWFQLTANVRVSSTRLGVFLEMEDLRGEGLREPGYEGDEAYTLPEAYIRGTLRMRATGVIEGDLDYEGLLTEVAGSLSRRQLGRLVYRPRDFAEAIRDDRGGEQVTHPGGNSVFKGSELPATESWVEDDWRLLAKYLYQVDRVRHAGPVVMVGLIFPERQGESISGYRPGDEVMTIAAEDGQHAHDLNLASRDEDNYALIANINWRWNPGDGEKVSPEMTTTLTLEDPAAVVGFGSG